MHSIYCKRTNQTENKIKREKILLTPMSYNVAMLPKKKLKRKRFMNFVYWYLFIDDGHGTKNGELIKGKNVSQNDTMNNERTHATTSASVSIMFYFSIYFFFIQFYSIKQILTNFLLFVPRHPNTHTHTVTKFTHINIFNVQINVASC